MGDKKKKVTLLARISSFSVTPFILSAASEMTPNPSSSAQQQQQGGGGGGETAARYTRQEVASHKKMDDCWIIIDGSVYNISSWLKRHPGGTRVLMHYAGEDATVSPT